jgi:steroid 5-alpha reductase family enzyme
MLSSDKNIGIVARLVELFRHYLGLQGEYIKLSAIEKVVRLVTALIIVAVLALIIILVLIFFSLAVATFLSDFVGMTWAYLIVAFFYFVAFLLFLAFKKSLIEKPLVKFLTTLLMEN